MTESDDDDLSLTIRVKLLVNSYTGRVNVEETRPELLPEKADELVDIPLHFEYEGVLYRIDGDIKIPNGGGHLHYRCLRYVPEKKLSIADIVF